MKWLFRIRHRLLLVNALVVAVPFAGIGFARLYEREMLAALENDMIHQAQLLREVLLSDPRGLRLDERGPMLARAARHTVTRIRLVDPGGRVVADSHPGQGPTDIDSRRELRSALSGDYGAATRSQIESAFLFSALPLERDGRVRGVIYVSRSTIPVHAAMHRLRSSLYRLLAVALAGTVVLTLLFAATISRPLTRLTGLARRIAAGDRSARLALRRRDEIGDLARAIDAMARKLQEQAAQTRDLAANFSHECKAPLTSIRGAAELLADGAADDPAARARFLRNMIEDVDRLDRLVSRLLELSRALSDDPPDDLIDYPDLIAEVAPSAELDYRADRARILAPRAHVESVVKNLYENALAHAEPGTRVRIRVDRDGALLRTAVHNHGRPISSADLPRIWDRFFTTRAGQGGTGLGLPIVRAIVSARGGDVAVESDHETGTAFIVRLPLARTAPPRDAR
jgi:two-component system, OmpR family, sensor histidine kinase ChvG